MGPEEEGSPVRGISVLYMCRRRGATAADKGAGLMFPIWDRSPQTPRLPQVVSCFSNFTESRSQTVTTVQGRDSTLRNIFQLRLIAFSPFLSLSFPPSSALPRICPLGLSLLRINISYQLYLYGNSGTCSRASAEKVGQGVEIQCTFR